MVSVMWDLTLTVPFGVCERCYGYDTILSCWLHRNPAWSRRCRWHWLRSAPPQPTTLAEAKRRTNPCSCSKAVDTVQCFTVADFCLQGFFTSLSARGGEKQKGAQKLRTTWALWLPSVDCTSSHHTREVSASCSCLHFNYFKQYNQQKQQTLDVLGCQRSCEPAGDIARTRCKLSRITWTACTEWRSWTTQMQSQTIYIHFAILCQFSLERIYGALCSCWVYGSTSISPHAGLWHALFHVPWT